MHTRGNAGCSSQAGDAYEAGAERNGAPGSVTSLKNVEAFLQAENDSLAHNSCPAPALCGFLQPRFII
jgi:hypothetical protein